MQIVYAEQAVLRAELASLATFGEDECDGVGWRWFDYAALTHAPQAYAAALARWVDADEAGMGEALADAVRPRAAHAPNATLEALDARARWLTDSVLPPGFSALDPAYDLLRGGARC